MRDRRVNPALRRQAHQAPLRWLLIQLSLARRVGPLRKDPCQERAIASLLLSRMAVTVTRSANKRECQAKKPRGQPIRNTNMAANLQSTAARNLMANPLTWIERIEINQPTRVGIKNTGMVRGSSLRTTGITRLEITSAHNLNPATRKRSGPTLANTNPM